MAEPQEQPEAFEVGERMTTEHISAGSTLINRLGARVFVKAAGPKTITLNYSGDNYGDSDRVPRSYVDRKIASGYWTISA